MSQQQLRGAHLQAWLSVFLTQHCYHIAGMQMNVLFLERGAKEKKIKYHPLASSLLMDNFLFSEHLENLKSVKTK